MIQTVNIPQNVLDVIEKNIIALITERIARDPDVEDAYLRVLFDNGKFTIKCLYIEEHFDEHEDVDVPLLDLMIDRNNLAGYEDWVPDLDAIHAFVQSFRERISIDFCLN